MPNLLHGECGVCEKVVKSTGKEYGVQCDWCDVWQHGKCAGVSKEEYDVLQRVQGCKWFCQKCEVSCEKFKLVFEEICVVKSQSEKVMIEIEELRKEVEKSKKA